MEEDAMKPVHVFPQRTMSTAALLIAAPALLLLSPVELSAQGSPYEQPGTLIWNEEFSGSGAPDPSKWNTELWPPKVVNEELQTYTDRPENVRVENGTLI